MKEMSIGFNLLNMLEMVDQVKICDYIKRVHVLSGGIHVAILIAIFAVAGLQANIDYLVIQSAEYYRTLSRNAALDGADIVNYNPAGCAFLKDGLHLNISNQCIPNLHFSIRYDGKEYESTTPVWFLPGLYAVGKSGRFAFFGAFTVPAGGGMVDYKNGIPQMLMSTPDVKKVAMEDMRKKAAQGIVDNFIFPGTYNDAMSIVQNHLDLNNTDVVWEDGEIKANSMYLAGTVGFSMKTTDYLSISGGIRFIGAQRIYKGNSTYRINPVSSVVFGSAPLDKDLFFAVFANDSINNTPDSLVKVELNAVKKAKGCGFIFGIDLKPFENFNVAFRCETPTALEWTEKVIDGKDFSGFCVDGRKYRYDLPMMLAGGINFDPTSWLTLTASINMYLLKFADTGPDNVDSIGGYDDDFGTPFDVSAGIEYRPLRWLGIGVGYQYSNTGGNDHVYKDIDYPLPSHGIGGGVRLLPRDFLALTIGVGEAIFIPDHDETGLKNYSKGTWALAIGLDYQLRRNWKVN